MTPEERAEVLVYDKAILIGGDALAVSQAISLEIRLAIAEEREACAKDVEAFVAQIHAETQEHREDVGENVSHLAAFARGCALLAKHIPAAIRRRT